MVAIMNEVARGCVFRKGLAELLGGPGRSWMRGDRDVHDVATPMGQDNEHEQQSIRDGGHDEEIGGHDLIDVIGEERPPGLGRRAPAASHVSGHGRLTDVDAELQEFAVDSRRTPERIGLRHPTNQEADVRRDDRSTQTTSAFPGLEEPEAPTVPGEDRLGSDEDDGRPPLDPTLPTARPTAFDRRA